MTSTLAPPPSAAPAAPPPTRSRRAPRRAIRRWAWRLLRREWRQQLLILALLVVALAATIVGLGLVVNTETSDQSLFGTARTRLDIAHPAQHLAADIAAAKRALGTVEAIEHGTVPVPGSVTPVDLRAQDPHGVFGAPMLHLVSGRYPVGDSEVAVTRGVASTFGLKIGDGWPVNGRRLRVVGVVENPKNLQDTFALVAPGELRSPTSLTLLTDVSASTSMGFRPPGASLTGVMSNGASAAQQRREQALAVLLLATIGLTFIGLLAVAGFTVMAHRRLRALGMVGAVGASDRQVRRVMLASGGAVGTVGAAVGTFAGLLAWFALRPAFERLVGHRIDPVDIPWWAVIAAAGLAVLTALVASWWPARTAARMPIVAALSGRPTPPQPAHRFALLGVLLGGAGFVLLVLGNERRNTWFIVGGILATTAGMLMIAPLGIRALVATAGRAPVAVRLAVRDLGRYQARSGAALAAVSLAIGIAATIAISAAAEQAADRTLSGGNLPTNQLVVWLDGNPGNPGGPGVGVTPRDNGAGASSGPSAAVIARARRTADAIAQALHARQVLPLDAAAHLNTNLPVGAEPGGNRAFLGRPIADGGRRRGWNQVAVPFVASPAILDFYGIPASDVRSTADIMSARTDLAGTQLGTGFKGLFRRVTIQHIKRLPNYTSAPNTLVTERALRARGLTPQPVGWLVATTEPLTSGQLAEARRVAAAAGLAIESRQSADHSQERLRDYATITGLLVALGVLAMTVGLIRSETAGDLRTLTATGATGRTRRTLTAATAAALAVLGGLLGTAGAYLALIAWHWHHLSYLSQPPYLSLAVLVVGFPVAASLGGWLLGRAPATISRSALE